MKLVDYGSDSESEDSQEEQQKPQTNGNKPETQTKKIDDNKELEKSIPETNGNNEQQQGEEIKKKITIKYKDLPKFLNPSIHKGEKKDGWQPKSIGQLEQDRKKKMADLSESNDKKGKLTKVMRLPSPKNKLANEELSSFQLKKQADKPILPSYINPDTLFNEEVDSTLIEQYDQEDIYINKRYQNVQSNNEAQTREAKYAVNREVNQDELELLEHDTQNKGNIQKIQEITREQIIGDSNWMQNYQKQQQQNILKQGYNINSQQVDKTQKQKNQLNALAIDALANQDHLDAERSEQIRNAKRKRDRYGW